MKPHIGIKDEHLTKIADLLNVLLADEAVLYTKTRNYHWNETSPSFMELHKLFEEQYEALAEIADQVAERSRMLGQFAIGSMQQFLETTRLKEAEGRTTQDKMIKNLLADHESIIRALREEIETVNEEYKDQGTADFMTGVMEQHEKMAWMLRSYLG